VPLIHISTNCVFSGKAPNMTEKDMPDAEDAYSRSKCWGEPNSAVVLRCSIIGFERSGSNCGLLEWYCGSSGEVRGFKDHMWNGLTTLELSKTILTIVASRSFTPRLEHHYSENTLSKHDILCAIANYLEKPAAIVGIDAGARNYTLGSVYDHTKHPTIEAQLSDLFAVRDAYMLFHK
jgi:dTDP-4-dehydrorhamnose reductase